MKWLGTAFVLLLMNTAQAADKPIDYQTLDFTLSLSKLRAGNHDSSGTNNYYFQTKIYALPILKEEVKKTFAERRKSESDLGNFAEIKIDSLKFWVADKKPGNTQKLIKGDKVRSLIAEAMRVNSVAEEETSLLCVITMYEMNKRFGWLGEDTKVGESMFEIIPESLPRKAKIENKILTIADKQGTFVEIKLEYKELEPKAPQ